MGAYLCKDAEHAKQAKKEDHENAMLPASEKAKKQDSNEAGVDGENLDIPFADATGEEDNVEESKPEATGRVVNDYNQCSVDNQEPHKEVIEESHHQSVEAEPVVEDAVNEQPQHVTDFKEDLSHELDIKHDDEVVDIAEHHDKHDAIVDVDSNTNVSDIKDHVATDDDSLSPSTDLVLEKHELEVEKEVEADVHEPEETLPQTENAEEEHIKEPVENVNVESEAHQHEEEAATIDSSPNVLDITVEEQPKEPLEDVESEAHQHEEEAATIDSSLNVLDINVEEQPKEPLEDVESCPQDLSEHEVEEQPKESLENVELSPKDSSDHEVEEQLKESVEIVEMCQKDSSDHEVDEQPKESLENVELCPKDPSEHEELIEAVAEQSKEPENASEHVAEEQPKELLEKDDNDDDRESSQNAIEEYIKEQFQEAINESDLKDDDIIAEETDSISKPDDDESIIEKQEYETAESKQTEKEHEAPIESVPQSSQEIEPPTETPNEHENEHEHEPELPPVDELEQQQQPSIAEESDQNPVYGQLSQDEHDDHRHHHHEEDAAPVDAQMVDIELPPVLPQLSSATETQLRSDSNDQSDDQSLSNDLEIENGLEDVKEEELIQMVSDAVDGIMGDAKIEVQQHIVDNSTAFKDHSSAVELLES